MLPSIFKRPRSGSKLSRERDTLGYDEVGSGSSSSSDGDEERGRVSPNGAFPSTDDGVVSQLQVTNTPNPVPDPWSLHQENKVGENFLVNDDNIPTQQEAELLEAWMTKRKAIRIEQEKQKFQSMMDPRTGGFQQPSSNPHRKNVLGNQQETSNELHRLGFCNILLMWTLGWR